MAEGSEYELIPHREILELKAQIEDLKKQKGMAEQGAEAEIEITNKELYDSMNMLIEGINQMIKLFKKAGDEMSHYDESENFVRKLSPMEKKVDELTEQNKKIARGILAVADSIKEQLNKVAGNFDDRIRDLKDSMGSMPSGQAQQAMDQAMAMGQAPGMGPPPMGGGVPPPPIPPPQPPQ